MFEGEADQPPANNSGDNPTNDESTVLYTNGAVGVETDGAAGDTRIESTAMDVDEGSNIPHDAAASGLHLPDISPGASQMDETIDVLQRHINNEFATNDAGTVNYYYYCYSCYYCYYYQYYYATTATTALLLLLLLLPPLLLVLLVLLVLLLLLLLLLLLPLLLRYYYYYYYYY